MIEPLLYAALGALVATLLGLLALPAVWARAVRLTTKRLVNRLPVSVSEIVAAQDRLRAEHAINIRAMERRAEAATAHAARERVAAGRAVGGALGMTSENATLREAVATLTAEGAQTRSDVDRTSAEAAVMAQAFDVARAEALAAAKDVQRARKETAAAEFTADALRIELAAVESELAARDAERADLRRELAGAGAALAAKERDEADLARLLKAEASRVADAQAARLDAERRLADESAAFVARRAGAAREAGPEPAAGDLAALRAKLDEVADQIVRASTAPKPAMDFPAPRGRGPLQNAAERVRLEPVAGSR